MQLRWTCTNFFAVDDHQIDFFYLQLLAMGLTSLEIRVLEPGHSYCHYSEITLLV